jgi:hypothetical protein
MDWPNRADSTIFAEYLSKDFHDAGHAIASGSSSSASLQFFKALEETGH